MVKATRGFLLNQVHGSLSDIMGKGGGGYYVIGNANCILTRPDPGKHFLDELTVTIMQAKKN
jgi:hypothetical protein